MSSSIEFTLNSWILLNLPWRAANFPCSSTSSSSSGWSLLISEMYPGKKGLREIFWVRNRLPPAVGVRFFSDTRELFIAKFFYGMGDDCVPFWSKLGFPLAEGLLNLELEPVTPVPLAPFVSNLSLDRGIESKSVAFGSKKSKLPVCFRDRRLNTEALSCSSLYLAKL